MSVPELPEVLRPWLLLIGGVIGIATFVMKVRSDLNERKNSIESRRRELVNRWRKITVYQIISESKELIPFNDILHALISKSFDDDAPVNIKSEEITAPALRVLLFELVSEGVVGQSWPEKYGIVQHIRDHRVEYQDA